MKSDQFKIRRFIALTSFVAVLMIAVAVLAMVAFGDAAIAGKLSAASGLLTIIVMALIANFGHYSHQVHTIDTKGDLNESVDD
jgi:hypothetical protein